MRLNLLEKKKSYLSDLKLMSQVGSDGLLVAWSPPGQDEVAHQDPHQHH